MLRDGHCVGCGTDLRDGEGSRVIGVEYAYGEPHRYDGVSEWQCPDCGRREGRWTGDVLGTGPGQRNFEPRFGVLHD